MNIFCFILLIVSFESFAQIDSRREDNLIVYGQAIVTAPAEFVDIQFIIENKDEKFTDSYNKLKKKVENITSELNKIGINQSDISTSTFFTRSFDKLSFFDSDLKEYRISVKTTVKLKKLDLFESMMLTLIKNEVNQIENISYGINSLDSLGFVGIDLAIKQAIEKKNIMSKRLEIMTSGIISVEEIIESNKVNNSLNNFDSQFNSVVSIAERPMISKIKSFYVQNIEVVKRVKVVFKIANKI